jgi:uncharacterized protein (DUF952 family)
VSERHNDTPDVMYHLVAAEWYRDGDRARPYVPEAYAADGFIHCTDGMVNVVDVGNRYYSGDQRMYVALVIDRSRVTAEIRYEDDAKIYPHIYGGLNRDAITDILPMLRGPDGTFLPVEQQRSASAE